MLRRSKAGIMLDAETVRVKKAMVEKESRESIFGFRGRDLVGGGMLDPRLTVLR